MEIKFYLAILTHLYEVPGVIKGLNQAVAHKEELSVEERHAAIRRAIHKIRKCSHIRTRSYGQENLPKEGGFIMFSNHQGKYDALGIYATCDLPFAVVMDDAKKNQILTRQVMELCDGKGLVLNDPRSGLKVINEMAKEAKEGRRFLIFPEGGYGNNHNNLQTFKPGAFKASLKSGTPIVPVALIDSYKGYNSLNLGWVTTEVHYLPPIPYGEYKDMNTQQIAEMVRGKIADKINEVLENRWMVKAKRKFLEKIKIN